MPSGEVKDMGIRKGTPPTRQRLSKATEIDYTLGDKKICRGKQKELVKELVSTSMKEFEARSSKA